MIVTNNSCLRMLAITVRADIGGGPEHLFQLGSNFSADVDLLIACPNEPPYWDRFTSIVGPQNMTVIPHRAFSFSVLFRLARYIRARKVDVIHSHGKGAGLYGRALSLLTGAKSLHTFHGLHVGEYGPAKKWMYLTLERLMGLLTAATITVSESERRAILAHGLVTPTKLYLVQNGVVVPETLRPEVKNDILRIIAVSRFDFQKNADLLIDIAAGLKKTGKPFHLTILGQGEGYDAIATRIVQEGLTQNLTLAGPHSTPRDVFRKNHFFLSTSRWEGMPLAVLEAMSEGLCPVVTRVNGHVDLIDSGTNGLLFETAEEAVEALVSTSANERSRMGDCARQNVAENYAVSRMAAATESIAASLVSKQAVTPHA
ncbi:Glycosyltransferase involved in cell wall bisynthesis [Cognatiyoonia koreensis]|uniref:Glycosyltransferase involved in cell wall bisynthesis n=1 Tax=Cognatiyoonia koreensis TaxID=364200 RepID=A0A1I0RLJ8_9RHOB|nr:glycosyltransferase [Cognatiyoonia koreensis]SEW42013.1 Glycosyltransferase involved in cell wall bisynthesis [Cognatiyoonia koreensis]